MDRKEYYKNYYKMRKIKQKVTVELIPRAVENVENNVENVEIVEKYVSTIKKKAFQQLIGSEISVSDKLKVVELSVLISIASLISYLSVDAIKGLYSNTLVSLAMFLSLEASIVYLGATLNTKKGVKYLGQLFLISLIVVSTTFITAKKNYDEVSTAQLKSELMLKEVENVESTITQLNLNISTLQQNEMTSKASNLIDQKQKLLDKLGELRKQNINASDNLTKFLMVFLRLLLAVISVSINARIGDLLRGLIKC